MEFTKKELIIINNALNAYYDKLELEKKNFKTFDIQGRKRHISHTMDVLNLWERVNRFVNKGER